MEYGAKNANLQKGCFTICFAREMEGRSIRNSYLVAPGEDLCDVQNGGRFFDGCWTPKVLEMASFWIHFGS